MMSAELITIAEARRRVLEATPRLPVEIVALIDVPLGRVLAQDVLAAGDTPPFPSSAMDGYAVQAGGAGRELELVGESRAGEPTTKRLATGQAIRISTGAAVPAGAEAVIRQEDVEQHDGRIRTEAETAPGQNVRPAGEDMRAGTRVLTAGARLGAAEIAAAVAAGAGQVEVARHPRLSVLASGDELREPGAALAPGQIHNSNGPMLEALARAAGALVPVPGRLADDLAATTAGLERALAGSDVVVVTGGVSVGPHDHVKPALKSLGVSERFWGVALQPGKPTWFGTLGEKLVFGLPGNPVSAFVTFWLFVAAALEVLQGAAAPESPGRARLGSAVRRNSQREQGLRVRLENRDGQIVATPNGPQGSHIVTSLVAADALALIPPGGGELAAGEFVELISLRR
jgi:molybdopterin molybdotransferase